MVTIFLTLEQVLIIHHDQIDRYGGSPGIRDLSQLESAIFRPQTSLSDTDPYPLIVDKAAALFHSLIRNHPFIDGNKRTAVASVMIFFKLNGHNLVVEPNQLVEAVIKIETQKWDTPTIAQWLHKHLK